MSRSSIKYVQMTHIQLEILKAIGEMFVNRECEISVHKKINLNAHSLEKVTPYSYKTIRKNIKKFKELK